jgi:para-nitrobenzyl esterase
MHPTLKIICLLAMIGFMATLSSPLHAASLTVKTEQGKARGKTINDGKVKAFLGLPYAAPPVGNLRWKAPQPPANWKGERDATKFGEHCAQNRTWDDMMFPDGDGSENCLYLNVYSPASASTSSKLPVMFWIHGGGYVAGAASEPRHNGDYLPLKGVVLVTINYRLGIFGFLATSELANEAGGSAGNYGLLDMVAALRWVRANIRNFGGDPNNVTIFGESAGSFAVSTLMASPLSHGLFQKAIGESGAAFLGTPASVSLETEEKKDDEWAAALGVHSLAELRALPTQKLLDSSKDISINGDSPYVDGKLLTEPVEATYAAGRQAHVPLLAGWNRDENIPDDDMTVEKWKAFATEHFPEHIAEFLSLYPGATDEQAARSAADYGSDHFIALGTWKWLEAHRKTDNAPVYRYHFELPALASKYHSAAAFHSDEIEYVFGTLDTRPGLTIRPEDRLLSEQMMSYWTNFARTGDPNVSSLPLWPVYGKDNSLIHLDSTITSGPDLTRPRYEFLWKALP